MSYVISIDIGGTNLRVSVFDRKGFISKKVSIPVPGSWEEGFSEIERIIRGFIRDFGDMEGIGVGAPGPIDFEGGRLLTPPNLPGWRYAPIKAFLEEKFSLPVLLENDANCAAFAEYRLDGRDPLLYLTVSTGIGGGVVYDGRIMRGRLGGELGHIILDPDGPLCNCGSRGCLEAFASGKAIRRMAYERGMGDLSPEELLNLDDDRALSIFKEVGFYLGIGIASLVHIFGPRVVVIGGGVSGAWDIFIDSLKETLNERLMPDFKNTFELKRSRLGDDAVLTGSAMLLIESL